MIHFDHRAFFRCIWATIVLAFVVGIMIGGCAHKLLTLREMPKTDAARKEAP